MALLVSGGHTQLMRVDGVGRYELLGETLDDAAGEAFDKSAKLMGLGYPGGPALSKLAGSGDATRFELPRPMLHSGDLDFSFSGLKTAVLTRVKAAEQAGGLDEQTRADLAAATQAAIVEVLAAKSIRALKRPACAGWWWRGVGANQLLRAKLDAALAAEGAGLFPAAAPVHRQRRDDRLRGGGTRQGGAGGAGSGRAQLHREAALGPGGYRRLRGGSPADLLDLPPPMRLSVPWIRRVMLARWR